MDSNTQPVGDRKAELNTQPVETGETAPIPEGKEWAVGLSQDEFSREFCRRFPRLQDSVPNGEWWAHEPWPGYSLISGVKPGTMVTENHSMPQAENPDKPVKCKGCGKEYGGKGNAKHANLRRHETVCPQLNLIRA